MLTITITDSPTGDGYTDVTTVEVTAESTIVALAEYLGVSPLDLSDEPVAPKATVGMEERDPITRTLTRQVLAEVA